MDVQQRIAVQIYFTGVEQPQITIEMKHGDTVLVSCQ